MSSIGQACPSTPKASKKPRALRSQAREIVYNVHTFLSEQKKTYNLEYNTTKATAQATGISKSTVERIVREGTSGLAAETYTSSFSTPKKKHGGQNKIVFDSFSEGVVRRKIHEFYVVKKECPSVNKLLNVLTEDDVVSCGREVLRKKITEIGFKWKSCQSNRKLLIEKPEIAAWRGRYLESIRFHRKCQRPIIYLDETYLHSTHTATKCWQSSAEMGVTVPVSKGRRLIVVHAGGEMGFINKALLIFKSHTTTGDYHGDMNAANFTKWLEQQLIPNLPPHSVIVMDNASYHCLEKNKKPTSVTVKAKMQEWLTQKSIDFSPNMTKAQLMEIIKTVPSPKDYVLDEILKRHGHTTLRLPPYHPDLNPIELVWGYIKGKVGRDCLLSSLEDKTTFLEKCFSEYTQKMWQECCSHVKNIEEEYVRNDGIMDERIDNIIINVGGNTSSEESEEEDEI